MKIKIFSSNVRGLNEGEKRKLIKLVIRSQKVDLVCFLETKMQEMSEKVVKGLGVGRFLNWEIVNARAVSGGIMFFRTIGFWIFWCRNEEGSPSLVVLKILRMALFGCLWSYLGERNMISRINWVQLEFYGMIPSM